jgi:hypothetical protein
MGIRHRYRRTDLFLVRVWRDRTGDGAHDGDYMGRVEVRGKVQRVVSGEAYPFYSWQRLAELLREMVSGIDREPGDLLPDVSEK